MVALEVKDLHKSFGKNHVLKGVDFTLDEGQVLALVVRSRCEVLKASVKALVFGM